jgi:uncharacterized protein (DUF1684 family)
LDDIHQAYNDLFSCPLTPFENRRQAPAPRRAGEKVFAVAGRE